MVRRSHESLPLRIQNRTCDGGSHRATLAHAAPLASGNFIADNSFYSFGFTTSTAATYTFSSTSYAAGGFLPVLTLFNFTTGKPVDASNSGLGDVSITDLLGPSTYILYLTEFPNEAIGNLSDGFLFSSDPTATGDACGLTGKSFINDITCSSTPLGKNYSLNETVSAAAVVTPEPSSLMLMLAPAAAMAATLRRRRVNA